MSKTDFDNITNQITKTEEKVFKTTKTHQVKKCNFLKRMPAYRNTPVLDIKEEMGDQLIQQAINRWRAILTTEGAPSLQ